ncbi:MAG: UDP-glucose 4-epimerase, partial [Prevotella sp.]|nr:UDP-glucose 4-epimerase [Prevotella sp.]
SDNTRRLDLEETKAKIAALEYIQNELTGIVNLAK